MYIARMLYNIISHAKFNCKVKEKYSQNAILVFETIPVLTIIFETRIVNEKAESVEMFSMIKYLPDVETNDCTVMSDI